MSASRQPDTPVASELAPLEPPRVPVQDVSAIARGPYDPAGQPRLDGQGFALGLDGWNRWPLPQAHALVAEADRLGFTFAVATQAVDAEATLDPFPASNSAAADSTRLLCAPSVSLRAHLHPMHVARFVANLDHIGGGRSALVFEAGDDAARARAFGLEPVVDAAAETDEFVTLVKHAWAWHTPFDFGGRWYASRRAWLCGPRPSRLPRPFLALRGSAEDIDLAARSFDWLIVDGPTDVALSRAARERAVVGYGRRLAVFAAIDVTTQTSAELAALLGGLAQIDGYDGALLAFGDGLAGLHAFGTQVLPGLVASALRWERMSGEIR